MNIDEQPFEHYVRLTPHGDLDAHSSIFLIDRIRHWIDQGQVNYHVDMSHITYIASAGLGVFISHLDEVQQKNGKFVLNHFYPNVLEPFKVLGLDKLPNLILLTDDTSPEDYFKAE